MQAPTFAHRKPTRLPTACRAWSTPVSPPDSAWPPAMQPQTRHHPMQPHLPPWLLGAALRLAVMAAAFTAALAWWPA
jgi:hypothetical protein